MPYDSETGEWIDPVDDGEGEGQGQGQRSNAEWAALRKEKAAAKKASEERDAALRELAFTRAGLDPAKDPRLSYFIAGYKGEANPEAILAEATKAGFIAAPPTGPTPEQQQAAAAGGRMDAAGNGAIPVGVGEDAAIQALDAAYLAGGSGAVLGKLAEMGLIIAAD
jgi:hypothetical protein